jgi:hypothetical protein
MKSKLGKIKQQFLIIIVVILAAGDLMIALSNRQLSLKLLPIFLAIVFALMLIVWKAKPLSKLYFCVSALSACFIIGWLISALHIISYKITIYYSMGIKIAGVPIILSLVWAIATLSIYHIFNLTYMNRANKIALVVLLCLCVTTVVDKFAFRYDIWQFNTSLERIVSYIIWAGVASFAIIIMDKLFDKDKSILLASIAPILTIYFWLMTII